MAELTEQQYQDLIIAEVGDDAQGTLVMNVPLYWSRHDGISDLETRMLYVKRDALRLMLGRASGQVDLTGTGGASIKLDQKTAHLSALLGDVEAAIAKRTLVVTPGSIGVSGQMTW